jgi:hypothetical protein
MKLRELLQAIRLNDELKHNKIKLYLYVIDLDRTTLKEPKWSSELFQKYKACDVTSWNIKTNTIEISIETFGVEE